ncbi:MAG: hypothetical protein LBT94_01310 [Prevotellaceae bacterium]|jgi:hypothetical protein|nr:hypothetical protein [Prevotellaceae bacterium]
MDTIEQCNNFKLKFDGQQHQIDANVLISSLIHTTTIIQEINKSLDAGKKIEIKVKALEKGSFLINIELLESSMEALKNIFTRENIQIAANLVAIFAGVITIKKFCKGKKPKHIEENESHTTITNQNGDVITIDNLTFNIYENSTVVKDALSQNFEAIGNDPSITGFEVTDNQEKTIVRVDKSEFSDMAFKSEEILEGERIVTEAATLNIVRLSFEDFLKWEFYYRGNRISAKIKDPDFQKIIDKGESFAKGDTLEVELQITQKWDESVNTFINKSYQVNKIIRHLQRAKQQEFEFEK